MPSQTNLSKYADAIESWAAASDRACMPQNRSTTADRLCLKSKDQLSNMNTWETERHVVKFVNESFDVAIGRSAELGDRYRIVNAAARVLGLDHVVVARAAKILSRDAFRFSRMT